MALAASGRAEAAAKRVQMDRFPIGPVPGGSSGSQGVFAAACTLPSVSAALLNRWLLRVGLDATGHLAGPNQRDLGSL